LHSGDSNEKLGKPSSFPKGEGNQAGE